MASSSPTVWRRAIRGAVGDALAFWFPVACAGCGALDVDICEGCLAALVPRVVRRRLRADVEVFSALEFDGVAARVIRAMKSDGRTGLARALGPALAAALAAAPADATVTTVPASRAADRRRGYRPVDLLVRSAGARAVPLLRMRRRSAITVRKATTSSGLMMYSMVTMTGPERGSISTATLGSRQRLSGSRLSSSSGGRR